MTRVRMDPVVLVIGGGPAGLTAATHLARELPGQVLLLEREKAAGGIPRHSDHQGYGLRDLRRVMKGPAYARRLVELARRSGVDIQTGATVTGWAGPRSVQVTTPGGLLTIHPQALVLATGARERPRTARLIPGDRPTGVYTTGQLQNTVHLHGRTVGQRAVVVGSELVSWSAVMTLRHAGCKTVLMTSAYRQPEAYAAFRIPGKVVLGVPIQTQTVVSRIMGRERVAAVELRDLDSGKLTTVSCDTVVFTGDWIADNELARGAGLTIDPASTGPVVNTSLQTSRTGVFAAGNLLHPVDTADVAAIDGRHVAGHVASWLHAGCPEFDARPIALEVRAPLKWVAPARMSIDAAAPPRGRLLLWTERLVRRPTVTVHHGSHEVARRTLPWPASPGRVFRVPWSLVATANVRPEGGPLVIGIEE